MRAMVFDRYGEPEDGRSCECMAPIRARSGQRHRRCLQREQVAQNAAAVEKQLSASDRMEFDRLLG
jgi:hypothetical protein